MRCGWASPYSQNHSCLQRPVALYPGAGVEKLGYKNSRELRALLERCAWAEVGVVSGGVGFCPWSSREPGQAMGVADCDQGETSQ